MTSWPAPSLRHVAWLTDDVGILEHARLAIPRRDLGYCTDDAAARAILGLGTAAARAPWPEVRTGVREVFDAAARFRSPHPRAMAYSSLGALEVLAAVPGHAGAASLVDDAAEQLARPTESATWPWPEPRLTYANALLPEAMLAVASATGRDGDVRRALLLFDWLVRAETLDGRFSFTPVGARGPSDRKPGFDQQPIEAWAMADACARAYSVTGDPCWADAVERAARWFVGDNDVGVAVFDPVTGGSYDGLEPDGVNQNQGAESALAFVATMARVRAIGSVTQAARSSAAAASRSSR